ncbi:MAG: hypothetical protein M1352_01585 [Patescibacteria group bacterium]|nr:hypothetical protein [Patescibacteria group bacterium]
MSKQLLKVFFGDGLLAVTLTDEKTQTLRWYRPEAHALKKGQRFLAVFAEGYTILCEATADTVVKPFSKLTGEDVRGSGYLTAEEAFADLRDHYYAGKGLKESYPAGIISYRIAQIGGVPVISLNE